MRGERQSKIACGLREGARRFGAYRLPHLPPTRGQFGVKSGIQSFCHLPPTRHGQWGQKLASKLLLDQGLRARELTFTRISHIISYSSSSPSYKYTSCCPPLVLLLSLRACAARGTGGGRRSRRGPSSKLISGRVEPSEPEQGTPARAAPHAHQHKVVGIRRRAAAGAALIGFIQPTFNPARGQVGP